MAMRIALIAGLGLSSFFWGAGAEAKVARHTLSVRQERVNLSGKRSVDFALTVNGGIPAPTLEFSEGDDAEITVVNQIENGEELSVHWHGILLPPEQDGVPYLNTPPIKSGESHVFRFRIRQSGTYWYHSHTATQEQRGVFGAIVIHPAPPRPGHDRDVVAILSDWSDEHADRIAQNLRKDGDYYQWKKGTVRSWGGALAAGHFWDFLLSEWARMGGMDLSDVGYDAFLMNGRRDVHLTDAKAGEKVRLRVINGSASTYFYVATGNTPLNVIAADGLEVRGVRAARALLGMGETLDLDFTVPGRGQFELRATAQDGSGFASGWIGAGEKTPAPDMPPPDLYAPMDHGHGHDHMASASHGGLLQTLTVDDLRATKAVQANLGPTHNLELVLGGDMSRYVWHLNGKAVHQDRFLDVKSGETVRIRFENRTMMHHPMHLHGHFFRVLNDGGDLSPVKHTVDVPPFGARTIEFAADQPGRWMLHCHNLFHMKNGMARVLRYQDYKVPAEIAAFDAKDPHLHDHIYSAYAVELSSLHAQAEAKWMRTWDELLFEVEARARGAFDLAFKKAWEYEGEWLYRRWFGRFFNLVGGANAFDSKVAAVAGIGYMLPFLIETRILVDQSGHFRLDFERRIQWTRSVYSQMHLTLRPSETRPHRTEFEASLMYGPSWTWAVGFVATERLVGAGAQFRF